MSVSDAIVKLRQRLQSYPLLSYHDDGQTITIDPTSATGFSVSLTATGRDFIVRFDGWYEHFNFQVDAINYFILGLSDQYRLKVLRRGGTDYQWTLEYRTAGGWNEDSTIQLPFFPFWRKREIICRQNAMS